MPDALTSCKAAISEMLRRSQTKAIFPVTTLGLLGEYTERGTTEFSHADIRRCYACAVAQLVVRLGHDLHTGARYETAYASRSLYRYGVLRSLPDERFELTEAYQSCARELAAWIPGQVEKHVQDKLGIIPLLGNRAFRSELAEQRDDFLQVMSQHIDQNPTNFEVFSFAIIKVHLEKFACRIYRDSRTAAHDRGVDLSTNFGVVYQIKKLSVLDRRSADAICAELRLNFDEQRFEDGKVVLIIDDVAKDVRSYLVDMRVQAISKDEILRLAANFEDMEDREKVLRVVHEEFSREYRSSMSPQAG
jgi:hypothetical protein